MRGPRTLAVIFVLLLVSTTVWAQEHHEDPADPKGDGDVLDKYIEDTWDLMNRTLKAILNDDPITATDEMNNLSKRVVKVGETLEKIPSEISSYEVLSEYYYDMKDAQWNLSKLVVSYSTLMDVIGISSNISIDNWNLSGVREPLEEFNDALIILPILLIDIENSINLLRENLETLVEDGQDLGFQLDLLEQVEEHIDTTDVDWIVPELIEGPILQGFIADWAVGLDSILDRNMTMSNITSKLDLLQNLELSHELESVVLGIISNFSEVEDSLLKLDDLLYGLKEYIGILEVPGENIAYERYSIFLKAKIKHNELEKELNLQQSIHSSYSIHDPGMVEENLTELEILIYELKDRLSRINIWRSEMQKMADLASESLLLNLIGADSDADGNISLEEARVMVGPEDAEIGLDSFKDLIDPLLMEIDQLQGFIDPVIHSQIMTMADLYTSIRKFTDLHHSIIDEIQFLIEADEVTTDHFDSFSRFTGQYLGMVSELEELSMMNGSLKDHNITFNDSSVSGLYTLIEDYRDLVLNVTREWNITGIYLEFERSSIWYDEMQIVRVLVVEKDINGHISYLQNGLVNFTVEALGGYSVGIDSGIAELSFVIDRTMELGSHTVNASYLTTNGIYLNISKMFNVQRMETLLGIDPDEVEVAPGEVFDVNITVIGQNSRFIPGIINILDQNITIDGNVIIPLSFTELGDHEISVNFLGDRWTASSQGALLVKVRSDPVIHVDIEKKIVHKGELVNGTISLLDGSGLLWVELSEYRYNWTNSSSGSSFRFSFDTSGMEVGAHSLNYGLISDLNFSRDLRGRIVLTVLDPHPEVIEQVDDDDDDEIIDDDDEDDGGEKFYETDLFRFGATVILIIVILAIVVFTIYNMFVKKQGPVLILPARRSSKEKEETEGSGEAGVREKTSVTPERSIARDLLPPSKMDPNRIEVVRSYLEVVDRAPRSLDIKRSDTPRETRVKLVQKGAEKGASSELARSFEEAVYREGEPTKQNVEAVKGSAERLMRWYDTLPTDENQ